MKRAIHERKMKYLALLLSATIAGYAYPPPEKYRQGSGPPS